MSHGWLTGGLAGLLFCLAIPTADAAYESFTPLGNGSAYPSHCDGRSTATPSIRAFKLDTREIHVDGRLDEPIWQEAECGRGFRVWDPQRGAMPTEETVFKVAYDHDAVYFAVACIERDPTKITSNLSRRDRFSDSDLVSIYIDPYHDRITGYNFKVNPKGVLMDAYVFNDGEIDQNWDAVWTAETTRDDQGWYVEMRIPFSSIRYRAAQEMTWGLQVYRYMHGRGEDTAWVTWDRETRGFVSRFGELQGMSEVPPPRQLEFLPYFLQRFTDPIVAAGTDEVDGTSNIGADIKYGVTSDLTLNATIQPDFGQVEADPSTLNLSPFETFFEEKRPFFVEGNRFFQHPEFNLFYSRRIGTGDLNSRIRFASKLTGKVPGNISVAALAAATDVTGRHQGHNVLKGGDDDRYFFVGRVGKDFNQGNHRVNLMQTMTVKTSERDVAGDMESREAATSGLDFNLNFKNRTYNVQGSWVWTAVSHEASAADPSLSHATEYGTGGTLEFAKLGGNWRGNVFGRWEGDRLLLNDVGYLSAPDEIVSGAWLGRIFSFSDSTSLLNRGEINFNIHKSWLYGARQGFDVDSGELAWGYGRGHRQGSGGNVNSWMQFRSFWEGWWGIEVYPEGSQRYETRGGPLISEPTTWGGWIGGLTDSRARVGFDSEVSHIRDTAQNHTSRATLGVRWNQSSTVNHRLNFSFTNRIDDTQYLKTAVVAQDPGGVGIGGLSYVFGDIHEQIFSLTLRTNVLFTRNQSLEVYAQPYIDVGDYRRVRELAVPDSYELIPYSENDGFAAADQNFGYSAVNLNVVYRWEYRPGSTLYIVWTQGREDFDTRGSRGPGFENSLLRTKPFSSEPENRFLIKASYWFSL